MNAGLKRKGTVSAEAGKGEKSSGTQNGVGGSGGGSIPMAQEQKKEPFNPRVRDARIFYAGPRGKRKYNQKQVVNALVAADGSITAAAKSLGTTFRHLKKYIEENEKMTEVHTAIEEDMLDLAEGTLRKHIEEGNLTATIFYLKTRGKKRGYIEDEKVDMSKMMRPVAIIYHSPRDPALLAAKQKQIEDNTVDITPESGATPNEND